MVDDRRHAVTAVVYILGTFVVFGMLGSARGLAGVDGAPFADAAKMHVGKHRPVHIITICRAGQRRSAP